MTKKIQSNIVDDGFFTAKFRNTYNDIETKCNPFASQGIGLPNILNFDLESGDKPYNTPVIQGNAAPGADIKKISEKKCGIKTLLNTKSKLSYPQDQTERIRIIIERAEKEREKEKEMAPRVGAEVEPKEEVKPEKETEEKEEVKPEKEPEGKEILSINTPEETIQKIIEQESLSTKENLIELSTSSDDVQPPQVNLSHKKENISDIEDSMNKKMNEKKADIKNNHNIIVNMNDKVIPPEVPEAKKVEVVIEPIPEAKEEKVEKVEKTEAETKTEGEFKSEKDEWPQLTIDMIGTSFKVIADLPTNAKLKIVDRCHLAEDNSYIGSISRYSSGQSRDKIISFLDHLFCETERNIWTILSNIRSDVNVDTNVSVLQGTVAKLHIFLHRYENMRSVYKSDSSAFARLGIIRDKFYTFLNTLFRDMSIPKKRV